MKAKAKVNHQQAALDLLGKRTAVDFPAPLDDVPDDFEFPTQNYYRAGVSAVMLEGVGPMWRVDLDMHVDTDPWEAVATGHFPTEAEAEAVKHAWLDESLRKLVWLVMSLERPCYDEECDDYDEPPCSCKP